MSTPDRACPDYPNECVHPWAHARTYAEVKATQPTAEPLSWDDCAAVADALKAAPGSGEIWRSSYGDIVGEPLSLARVAVEALTAAGCRRLPEHLLPLLDLTADEIDALREVAFEVAADSAGAAGGRATTIARLRSALDKLTPSCAALCTRVGLHNCGGAWVNHDHLSKPCCDLHNTHCEPPADLCCYQCIEAAHPDHRPGERCVLAGTSLDKLTTTEEPS